MLAVAAVLVGVLARTGGAFVYTLDDPYIHLALAEEIARGGYGVNPDAFAAPSSSVLWPFLLSLWVRLPGSDIVPFAINVTAGLATIGVYVSVLEWALRPASARRAWAIIGVAATGAMLATNLVGIAFTGMEHSLQVFLAVAGVWGLWLERDTGNVPAWLLPALVLGPLVRYENLAVSGAALLYLFVRGHRRSAMGGGIALAVVLGGFSAFLASNGGAWLPSSVLAKSKLDDGPGGLLGGILANLRDSQGRMLSLVAVPLLAACLADRRDWTERLFAAAVLLMVALHFVGGDFGWLSRYEIYVTAAALVGLTVLYGDALRRVVGRGTWLQAAVVGALAVCLYGFRYVGGLGQLPGASANIYEQHVQLHRFVTQHYAAPVAVNDLGWMSYRNDGFVLDLYGLGSYEALRLRTSRADHDWITPLADRHRVKLAMVYDAWFPDFPADWIRLGTLYRTGPRISAGANEVAFYARDAGTAQRAHGALRAWAEGLPPGTGFDPAPASGPRSR